jgi:hypothetical protein
VDGRTRDRTRKDGNKEITVSSVIKSVNHAYETLKAKSQKESPAKLETKSLISSSESTKISNRRKPSTERYNIDGVDGSDAAILHVILIRDPKCWNDASDEDELRQ